MFISPISLAATGSGSAIRAGVVAEALAARYRVHALLVPVVRSVPAPSGNWCEQVRTLPVAKREGGVFRYSTRDAVRQAERLYRDIRFDAVHVFRLYLADFAEPYLAAGIPCTLDMDDVDSINYRRRAAICPDDADWLLEDAERFTRKEREWVPRFDRVFVASQVDRERFDMPNIEVLPNAVRIPRIRAGGAPHDGFTFLFIGALNYHPNEDAVFYFCQQVLPLLRNSSSVPCRFLVAGRRPPDRVLALDREPGIRVVGEVTDPAVCYEQADASIAPLRAGGGTRIKILEAAAYQCPVVSTTLGAEGLLAAHDRELLIADSPSEFAHECRRLMEDAGLRRRLSESAYAWVRREHTLPRVKQVLGTAD